MSKISAYTALTTPAIDDELAIVDVSDTTMAASGTTKRITRDNLRREPWQFFVRDYGAVGDGVIGTGGTGTSGTTTFTDTGANWSAADIGKVIIINQGTSGAGTTNGTTQNPFSGTISSINSATSIELSAALGAACSNAPYIYGTDDVSAIQSAVDAAETYANANGWYAEVIFDPLRYMLGTLSQVSTPATYNTHIKVPYGTQTGQRLVIRFVGMGAPQIEYWESEVPHLNGACLVSALFSTSQPDATFHQVSILGGPSSQGVGGEFYNTRLEIEGLSFIAPWNSEMYGVDGRWVAQMIVPSALFMAFVPVNTTGASIGGPYAQNVPSNGIAVGIAYPFKSNNAANYGGMVTGESVPYAVSVSEHSAFVRLSGLYTTSACYITSSPSVPHALTIQLLCCEGSANALDASDALIPPQTFPVNIGMIETEGITNSIVNDPNNVLTGIVRSAPGGASIVTVIGGQLLTVIDELLHTPGPWAGAPSAPASGTAQQNTSYRPATIYCAATTSITGISTGAPSASTGLTSTGLAGGANVVVPVQVAPGAYFSVTYTGTLTTTWILG